MHSAMLGPKDGSYSDALLVLEQGLSNLQRTDKSCENSIGKILLAMSALHSERGDLATALDKAQLVHGLPFASLALRVAALESATDLHLQMGQDAASLGLAEKCLQLLSEGSGADSVENEALQLQAKALKGLVDLVLGTPESAKPYFAGFETCGSEKESSFCGRVALSYAEYLHATGNLFLAKEYYQKALLISPTKGLAETSVLGALGMDGVHLSANCALGQVATHTGKFKEAEEVLTGALKEVEEHFGSNHPKVGMVLTCMADMFRQKGTLDGSSTLLIQEGLYRRAIDLMKAPSLDVEDIPSLRRDIVALARGGYAEALCVQQNRKSEGERMRRWAERAWTNRRMSLAQALDSADASNVCILDTRIERII
ncbi:uncharacterized protein LOC116256846 isoform X2 [Nymphaea colorata]|uniref:uncharacterized protein LOC116256846 isoform X2 n=1 Tax=Nymphaea colorata TaxID=210225 RepID=UPI00129EB8C4|nr:uncharacterized protein LOC116256846 isoform X2 [Nymphaea colorata]